MNKIVGVIALGIVIPACTGIAVQRVAYYPAKPDDCAIQIVNGFMQNPMMWASPTSEYELVGTITFSQVGAVDPFSEENVARLQPRACAMGGDAVSVMNSMQSNQ